MNIWILKSSDLGWYDSQVLHLILYDCIIIITYLFHQTKLSIVKLLTSPLVYCSTYQCIEHTFGDLDTQTFWPLIHILARHGIHLVDENDASINHSVLSSAKPFNEV